MLLGITALGLGLVGAILPGLPTVPFLLLATFCFARSSERLHNWLVTHPKLGPPIANWHQKGAIGRKAKWLATASVAVTFSISLFLGLRPMLLGLQALTLGAVMVFIWSRPEG